jgi:hypothetical protein
MDVRKPADFRTWHLGGGSNGLLGAPHGVDNVEGILFVYSTGHVDLLARAYPGVAAVDVI